MAYQEFLKTAEKMNTMFKEIIERQISDNNYMLFCNIAVTRKLNNQTQLEQKVYNHAEHPAMLALTIRNGLEQTNLYNTFLACTKL